MQIRDQKIQLKKKSNVSFTTWKSSRISKTEENTNYRTELWTEETQINILFLKDFTSLYAYLCTATLKGTIVCIEKKKKKGKHWGV